MHLNNTLQLNTLALRASAAGERPRRATVAHS